MYFYFYISLHNFYVLYVVLKVNKKHRKIKTKKIQHNFFWILIFRDILSGSSFLLRLFPPDTLFSFIFFFGILFSECFFFSFPLLSRCGYTAIHYKETYRSTPIGETGKSSRISEIRILYENPSPATVLIVRTDFDSTDLILRLLLLDLVSRYTLCLFVLCRRL